MSVSLPKEWNLRQELRTSKGAGIIANIVIEAGSNYEIAALVADGSLNGCGVVAITQAPVEVDCICRIAMDRYGPIEARVAWVREIEPGILRFGLEYIS